MAVIKICHNSEQRVVVRFMKLENQLNIENILFVVISIMNLPVVYII
ncbi:MAG: hypothetical protein ACOCV3_07220 [Halanaerobiales bacterium]